MSEYNERVATVSNEIIAAVREVLTKEHVELAEYRAALGWMRKLAVAGEVPLFIDNFFENTVERAASAGLPGSEGTIQGPYYVPGAPLLTETPFIIPMRDDEPGVPTVFKGKVVDLTGKPIVGALVDLWHAGTDGTYSSFVGTAPPMNLRAKMFTDETGSFEIRTIRPAPYQIPTAGPTGYYLKLVDRKPWRPAHFHFKLSADGFSGLTTQIYFEDDPWLDGDGDVSGGVKDSLIVELDHTSDESLGKKFGLNGEFLTASYTVTG